MHGCIGAVDPVRTFGSPEQKQRFLPKLSSGERLSAFALTEPGAGSDLTALKTRAVRDGDEYVVNGEKLFITNVVPGRTIGLVCLIDDRPAVLVADLPAQENEHFQLRKYGLYALKHTYNQGIIFKDFRVPAENLLTPPRGDGLTIAYHGLNLGRVALCANAAGTMRLMMASMIPWAHFRKTYGAEIASRELVQRRLGRMAALIVGCDALVQWCAGLLDAGYRGEMECIIAKIFGSEAQKEAAVDLFMKTHGGRSFLHGHMLGDNIHEFLAPCIYEGEGEMLGMAFFKSLVKQHGMKFFEPIGKALAAAKIKKPNPLNPAHAWALRKVAGPYVKWLITEKLSYESTKPQTARAASPAAIENACRIRHVLPAWFRRWLDRRRDAQTSMALGRSPMPHGVSLATNSGRGNDSMHEPVRRPFRRRSDPSGRRCAMPRSEAQTDRQAPQRPLLPHRHQAGRANRRRRFPSIAGMKPDEILMPYSA